MFGIGTAEVRSLAYQLAEASIDWLRGFMYRHPELSPRTPEARAYVFNKEAVNKFFNILQAVVSEHDFTPNNIYNVEEIGMPTVQNKPSKTIAKGEIVKKTTKSRERPREKQQSPGKDHGKNNKFQGKTTGKTTKSRERPREKQQSPGKDHGKNNKVQGKTTGKTTKSRERPREKQKTPHQ